MYMPKLKRKKENDGILKWHGSAVCKTGSMSK